MKVIVFKPGPIGDLLHSLPVVYSLKKAFPSCEVTLVAAREVGEIVEENPSIDRLLLIPGNIFRGDLSGFLKHLQQLRSLKPDLFVDLKSNAKSFLLRKLSGAGQVLFYRKERLKGDVPGRMHAVENLHATLAPLGISGPPPMYGIQPARKFFARAKEFLDSSLREMNMKSGESRVVIFNPFAGAAIPSRMWPKERFVEAGNILVSEGTTALFVTGSPSEEEGCREIASSIKGPVAVAAGKLSLGETAALIALADAVVSGDTGPLHIAAAVGTPVVGLYGSVSTTRSRPLGEGHVIIRKNLPCIPCEERECPLGTLQCMWDITAEEVAEAVRSILGKREPLNLRWENYQKILR